MNIEDIKVGETYLLPVVVTAMDNGAWLDATTNKGTYYYRLAPSETKTLRPIMQENSPKYDPNRLFREGDEVRVIEKDGRTVHDPLNGGIWRVARNERTGGAHEMSVLVNLIYEDEKIAHQIHVPFYFLELVTPVEELEPYSVRESDAFDIVRDGKIVMTIPFTEDDYYTFEQAKAAAEADRDRLNAEWREKQK